MIRNFLFHRVNPERDALWDPMDVKLFEKCIKHIANHYETTQIENLSNIDSNNEKIATISFDDGYADNLIYAAPILQKYNCKASFYVVTDCIEKNIPTWTHELKHRFMYTKQQSINLDFNFFPEKFRTKKLNNEAQRLEYVKKLKPVLLDVSYEQKTKVLEEVRRAFYDVSLPEIMMSWADLGQLLASGHQIGSHSVSHVMLGTTTNEDLIREELELSALKIFEKLGLRPRAIAYPVGVFNETVKKIAKQVGYEYGLAVNQTLYDPAKQDSFEIPRIELYNEPWLKTRLRINNSLEVMKNTLRYHQVYNFFKK
jgi:peptidoglycan/xylan/chitin deacetylase (PgdA/CDA1 family)